MDDISRRFSAQNETTRFLPDRSKRKVRGLFLESFYCHLVVVLLVKLGRDCWRREVLTRLSTRKIFNSELSAGL